MKSSTSQATLAHIKTCKYDVSHSDYGLIINWQCPEKNIAVALYFVSMCFHKVKMFGVSKMLFTRSKNPVALIFETKLKKK